MVMGNRGILVIICMSIMFLFFAVLVWPGIYYYDHMVINAEPQLIRVNRLTGKVEFFVHTFGDYGVEGGWYKIREPRPTSVPISK